MYGGSNILQAIDKLGLFLEGNTIEQIKELEKKAKKNKRRQYDKSLLEQLK